MASRIATVAARQGLHARPAALFAQAVANSGLEVLITYDKSQPANASSILTIMALDIPHGAEVTLSAEGENAERTLDELVSLLATDSEEMP